MRRGWTSFGTIIASASRDVANAAYALEAAASIKPTPGELRDMAGLIIQLSARIALEAKAIAYTAHALSISPIESDTEMPMELCASVVECLVREGSYGGGRSETPEVPAGDAVRPLRGSGTVRCAPRDLQSWDGPTGTRSRSIPSVPPASHGLPQRKRSLP